MELVIAAVALAFSMVSAGAAVLLYLHREETHALQSKQRSIELELADIADRLSVWQRRDAARARKVDGPPTDEQRGLFSNQHGGGRDHLRAVARERGLIK